MRCSRETVISHFLHCHCFIPTWFVVNSEFNGGFTATIPCLILETSLVSFSYSLSLFNWRDLIRLIVSFSTFRTGIRALVVAFSRAKNRRCGGIFDGDWEAVLEALDALD